MTLAEPIRAAVVDTARTVLINSNPVTGTVSKIQSVIDFFRPDSVATAQAYAEAEAKKEAAGFLVVTGILVLFYMMSGE